jgi:hypothetical protein
VSGNEPERPRQDDSARSNPAQKGDRAPGDPHDSKPVTPSKRSTNPTDQPPESDDGRPERHADALKASSEAAATSDETLAASDEVLAASHDAAEASDNAMDAVGDALAAVHDALGNEAHHLDTEEVEATDPAAAGAEPDEKQEHGDVGRAMPAVAGKDTLSYNPAALCNILILLERATEDDVWFARNEGIEFEEYFRSRASVGEHGLEVARHIFEAGTTFERRTLSDRTLIRRRRAEQLDPAEELVVAELEHHEANATQRIRDREQVAKKRMLRARARKLVGRSRLSDGGGRIRWSRLLGAGLAVVLGGLGWVLALTGSSAPPRTMEGKLREGLSNGSEERQIRAQHAKKLERVCGLLQSHIRREDRPSIRFVREQTEYYLMELRRRDPDFKREAPEQYRKYKQQLERYRSLLRSVGMDGGRSAP